MVVHIYGLPVDMDPVIELARRHSLFIIEDAAEQHGQTYKGRPVGSLGDIATVSFYPNKHVTTGEGGMVVTNSDRTCRTLPAPAQSLLRRRAALHPRRARLEFAHVQFAGRSRRGAT